MIHPVQPTTSPETDVLIGQRAIAPVNHTAIAGEGPHAQMEATLAHKTVRGFFWVSLDAVSSKVVGMLAQMALARMLLPEDWGLVGLAFTVSAFAELIAYAGFREVLVQRRKRYNLWANPAAWLSLVFGVAASLLMVALAPVAAWFYQSPKLPGLIHVLALGTPFVSLASVPEARLRSQMRFRALSVLSAARNTGTIIASVGLAAMGFGAYAYMAPRPLFAAVAAIGAWWLARPPVHLKPQVRRWRFLLTDSALVLLASLVLMMIGQAGYVVLGRLCDEKVVGYYFFAYNLSIQTAVFLGLNLAGVLFPALATLQRDPPRQLAAFVRASRMLAAVGMPLCFLQAAVAAPTITVFFGERVLPTIPVFAVLSIGMGYHVMWNPSRSLLQSSGRFRLSLLLIATYASLFIPSVVIGAMLGQALGVAIATAAVFTIIAPIDTYIAVRTVGGGWREVWSIYALPSVFSLLAIGFWMIVCLPLPAALWAQVVRLILIPVGGLTLYAWLLARQAPGLFNDIRHRLHGLGLTFLRVRA